MSNPRETKLLSVTTDTPVHSLSPDIVYRPWPNEQRTFLGNIATGFVSQPRIEDVYAHVRTDPTRHKDDTALYRVYKVGNMIRRRRVREDFLRVANDYELFVKGDFGAEDSSFSSLRSGEEILLEDHQAIKLAIEKGFIDEADVAPRYIGEWQNIDPTVVQRAMRLKQGQPTHPMKLKRPT